MNGRLEEYNIGGLLDILCRDDMIRGLVDEIKNILDEEKDEVRDGVNL